MSNREVMQQALEALDSENPDIQLRAALALRTALEQEPLEYWNAVEGWVKIDEVREHFDSVGCGTIYKTAGEDRVPLYTTPPAAQPEQEPVISAWSLREVYFDEDGEPLMHRSPPAAERPWVGLTDEDKKKIATAAGCTDDDDGHIVTEIFRLAEAKLKERNGY